jgi:hypothetical protein
MTRPLIGIGAHNDAVRYLQQRLVESGFAMDSAEIMDGIFSTTTTKAVRTFQAAHALLPDGIVGSKTWAALEGDHQVDEPPTVPAAATTTPGFTHAASALNAALADLRAGVVEIPPGSNRSPRIDEMTGWTDRPPGQQGPAWCAYAATTWWNKTPLPRFGSVDSIIGWARRRGLFHDPLLEKFKPTAGDIFCVVARNKTGSVPPDGGIHTGLVLATERLPNMVITIEGNSANRVRSIRRPSENLAYVRIPDSVVS